MTTNRRSFLKGLSAALVVPSPVLWTPEERELVAELPADIEPEVEPAGFSTPRIDPAHSHLGWFMAVMPAWRMDPFEVNWTAMKGRLSMLELNAIYERAPTMTFTPSGYTSSPAYESGWEMRARVYGDFVETGGRSPREAARGLDLFQ